VKKAILLLTVTMLAGCGGNTSPSMQNSANSSAPAAQAVTAKPPDESAALDAIAKINDAQANYFRRNRRYALTFDELVDAHLLNSAPSAETGYDFTLRPAADAQTYKLAVNPAASSPSVRHFLSDESGAVHAEAGRDATSDSPKI
jgi:uncharacterized lipoprotein YmbA